jgi:integrase
VARHRGPRRAAPQPHGRPQAAEDRRQARCRVHHEELAALLGACKGGGFQNRRDYAIISLFKDTGARLSELAGLTTGDIVPREREAV